MTDKQPFLGAIAGAVLLPAAKELIKAGVGAAIQKAAQKVDVPIAPEDAPRVTVAVANEMAKDPKLVNAMNAEPAYQSRVVVGSSAAIVGQFVPAVAIPQLVYTANLLLPAAWDISQATTDYMVTVASALIVTWGAGYALYGRLRSGLDPLFARWRK